MKRTYNFTTTALQNVPTILTKTAVHETYLQILQRSGIKYTYKSTNQWYQKYTYNYMVYKKPTYTIIRENIKIQNMGRCLKNNKNQKTKDAVQQRY